jgi:hypothetical protein
MGLGTLGLINLLAEETEAGVAPKLPHFAPTAKRVIHFFLNGGPSHVDTFDPKPKLAELAGKTLSENLATERKTGTALPSPFKFQRYGESGLPISELFQRTAKHADDIAVIRSMYAEVPNHEPSLMLMNCGDSIQSRPSFGSWMLYGLGTENQNLPGFIAMCPGGLPIKDNENWQAGFLPGSMQGTYVDSQHQDIEKLIANIQHPHVSTFDQRRQLDLLARWNARHQANRADDRLNARIQSYELAFGMQSEAAEAFDISREPQYILDAYGSGVHARQTLIARRLVERGVRFVQLWHGAGQPWDNHSNIEAEHRKLSGQLDQPVAALLSDLKQRGMLEDTLVLFGGEFGRTPTVELDAQGNPINGRDHNHWGFSVWLAGGGIKGGTTYGATDEIGFKAVENPTSVHDLHATILHALGMNHKELTYRYAGRDFRLTDVHGNVIHKILKSG